MDWDKLTGEQRTGLLKAGAGVTRNKKTAESRSDFEGWKQQAADRGYHHEPIVQKDRALKPERGPEFLNAAALHSSEKEFTHRPRWTKASSGYGYRGFRGGGIGIIQAAISKPS